MTTLNHSLERNPSNTTRYFPLLNPDEEKRVLLAALRALQRQLLTRIKVCTVHAKRETIENLNKDLQITKNLITALS